MAGIDNLKPWKPGQSGNPKGGSKKATSKKLLREFVQEGINSEVTAEVCEKLELDQAYAGAKVGQIIATEIILRALKGGNVNIDRIINMEPRAMQIEAEVEGVEPKSPVHVPQPEDEAALLADVHTGEQVH